MTLAIAILNFNGKQWLEKFLPSVIQHSQPHTIYVIDNQSTDGSLEWLKAQHTNITPIENKSNLGFTGGYNEGLQSISEDIVCLLNSDVEVTKNWIDPIYELMISDPEIAAVQPKILDYNKPQYFEYAGAAGGFLDNLGYPYCRGRMFFELEKDEGQYNDTVPIFWATGACLFIRREDFWKAGAFDTQYFAHMEEIDLCWRLHNLHKKVYYCGLSSVYHVGGGTLEANSPRKTFLNIRNSLFNLLKNLPSYRVGIVVFQRLILDGLAAFYFLFKSGFPHFWAVLKAHFSFYSQFISMWRKRKPGLPNYYQRKYIVLQYFIKGQSSSSSNIPEE